MYKKMTKARKPAAAAARRVPSICLLFTAAADELADKRQRNSHHSAPSARQAKLITPLPPLSPGGGGAIYGQSYEFRRDDGFRARSRDRVAYHFHRFTPAAQTTVATPTIIGFAGTPPAVLFDLRHYDAAGDDAWLVMA